VACKIALSIQWLGFVGFVATIIYFGSWIGVIGVLALIPVLIYSYKDYKSLC